MKNGKPILFIFCISLFNPISYAQNQDVRLGFLAACESSAHVDEEANCSCVYAEIEKTFGKNEAITLISYVNGTDQLDRIDNASFALVVFRCSNLYSAL